MFLWGWGKDIYHFLNTPSWDVYCGAGAGQRVDEKASLLISKARLIDTHYSVTASEGCVESPVVPYTLLQAVPFPHSKDLAPPT